MISDQFRRIADRSLLVLSLFELILVAATWPVWQFDPQVPRIPLIAAAARVPFSVHQIALILFLGSVSLLSLSLIRRLISTSSARLVFCGLALASGLLLTLMSTHRIQAWHVLFLESLFVIVVCDLLSVAVRRQVAVLQLLPAIIYGCSALSRCSANISESMTAQVVRVLLNMSGLTVAARNPTLVSSAAWGFALGELLIGIGLSLPQTRRWFVAPAMLLHVLLFSALGPWGLNHHHGVLLWNCCFLCLIPALYGSPIRSPLRRSGLPTAIAEIPSSVAHSAPMNTLERWTEFGLMTLLTLFPLSSLFGIADNWPGWQLYSSRPEVWGLYVRESSVSLLAEGLKPYVEAPQPLDDWCPVRIDRWVLRQSEAPLYPEDRFQLGLILAVTKRLPNDDIRVVVDAPRRWDYWNRESTVVQGRESLEAESIRFLLNARAVNPPGQSL